VRVRVLGWVGRMGGRQGGRCEGVGAAASAPVLLIATRSLPTGACSYAQGLSPHAHLAGCSARGPNSVWPTPQTSGFDKHQNQHHRTMSHVILHSITLCAHLLAPPGPPCPQLFMALQLSEGNAEKAKKEIAALSKELAAAKVCVCGTARLCCCAGGGG